MAGQGVVRGVAVAATVWLLSACSSLHRQQPIQMQSGVELYQRLCASCHGVEGRGDGPVAPSIKIHVPDLTRLAFRDGGEFSREDVSLIIDGRTDRRAHGPRDMPVWGWQLYDTSAGDDSQERARTNAVIARLVDYLQSVQRF